MSSNVVRIIEQGPQGPPGYITPELEALRDSVTEDKAQALLAAAQAASTVEGFLLDAATILGSSSDQQLAAIAALATRVLPQFNATEQTLSAALADEFGRIGLLLYADGKMAVEGLEARSFLRLQAGEGIEIYNKTEEWSFALVDPNGRLGMYQDRDGLLVIPGGIASSSEVVEARGSRSDLDARLSQTLDAYGLPVQLARDTARLREWRMRRRKRLLSEPVQSVLGVLGDSWSTQSGYYARRLASYLTGTLGDAGAGYVGFGWIPSGTSAAANGSARADVTLAYAGSWSPLHRTEPTPDLSAATSSSAGSKISITAPSGQSEAVLSWVGTAAGAVRYRFNGGGWTIIDVTGSGGNRTSLAGVPGGAILLELEVVSGNVTLGGVDFRSAASGVRYQKLANSGGRASDWATVDASQWQAAVADMGIQTFIIFLGTNDQAAGSAAEFKTNLTTMIARVRAAVPNSDILVVTPPENPLGRPVPMTDLATAAREVAATNDCAFLDLQHVFGTAPAEYNSSSVRPWLLPDDTHPSLDFGGVAVVDAFIRTLES